MVFQRLCLVNRWCCGEGEFQQHSRILQPDGVTPVVDGKIVKHQRLDEVWTLLATPDKFNAYISKAIDKYTGDEL